MSEGWSATAEGIDRTWSGGYEQAIRLAEEALGRHPLKRSEVSEYWYAQGWKEIAADPGHFVWLLFRKLCLTFNGYEIPNNQNIYLVRDYAPIMKPLMFAGPIYFPYGIVAPLALIGLALSLRRWKKFTLLYVFLAAYIGTLLFFFITARFRQPFLPVLLLFASYAVVEAYGFVRKRRFMPLVIAGIAFIALLFETNHNMMGSLESRISSYDHFMLGTVYEGEDKPELARVEYEKSLQVWPGQASAMVNLGILEARQGQNERAARYFSAAISTDSSLFQPYLNLAVIYGRMGKDDQAVQVLERARDRYPVNPDIQTQLALAYYRLGRYDDALKSGQATLRLNPADASARKLLERLRSMGYGE
jgi:tetratricopeptide (TPR) repeat protein